MLPVSLFFFMPLCLLLGGEGDTGSISCSKKGGNKGKEQEGEEQVDSSYA